MVPKSCWVLLIVILIVPAELFGAVTIGGVEYDHVDPGAPFTEAPRPAQNWSPPPPTPTEQAAGAILFQTPDPGDLAPYRLPKPEEHLSRLSVCLAQGETTATWLGTWTLDDLRGIDLHVELAQVPVSVEVRRIHCWPQRTGWRSREFKIIPELLLPCGNGKTMLPRPGGVLKESEFRAAAGEAVGFWLTLSAPKQASAGDYRGEVVFTAKGRRPLRLPVRLTIYPFTLPQSEKRWLVATNPLVYRLGWPVKGDFQDMVAHGITGCADWSGLLDYQTVTRGEDGKIEVTGSPEYNRLVTVAAEVGMTGPFICWYEGAYERVAAALGLEVDFSQPWPEELFDGIAQLAQWLRENLVHPEIEWYFQGSDEPKPKDVPRMKQNLKAWHEAGVKTSCTAYTIENNRKLFDQVIPYLDAPVLHARLPEDTRTLLKQYGAELWFIAGGSYLGCEGNMFPNRDGGGFRLYRSDAYGCWFWTFRGPGAPSHGDPFNDFDGVEDRAHEPKDYYIAYPHFAEPNKRDTWIENIPTIQWEAIREGINDYKYCHLLERTVRQARRSPSSAVRSRARQAQRILDNLPWPQYMAQQTGQALVQLRRLIAGEIVALQQLLAGKSAQASAGQIRGTIDFTLRSVLMTGQEQWTRQQVMTIPDCSSPPVIDGQLSDECWKSAAQTTGFHYTGSGELAKIATTAMAMTDKNKLYVAFDCVEPLMDRLRVSGTIWADDNVELFVAPHSKRERYVHFLVNTAGKLGVEGCNEPEWAVRKRDDGWSVELAIPWEDLAELAALPWSAAAINFCRCRYTDPDPSPFLAWSPTYGGFHQPGRFGLALLADTPVHISDVFHTAYWGSQTIRTRLRNVSKQAHEVDVTLDGGPQTTMVLAPEAKRTVSLNLAITEPGLHDLKVGWRVDGQGVAAVPMSLRIPPAVVLNATSWLAHDGEEVKLVGRINAGPQNSRDLCLRCRIRGAGGLRETIELPAHRATQHNLTLPFYSPVLELEIGLWDKATEQYVTHTRGQIFLTPRLLGRSNTVGAKKTAVPNPAPDDRDPPFRTTY